MIVDPRERCVACGGVVDPRGVNGEGNGGRPYCACICTWPGDGCRKPIFFRVNANEKRQPFDYDGTPHHATCAAYRQEKQGDRICPACGGARPKGRACNHCGWRPAGQAPDVHRMAAGPPGVGRLEDFGKEM